MPALPRLVCFLTLPFVLFALPGCVSLEPTPDPTEYFVLAVPPGEAVESDGATVLLRRPEWPEYLTQREIAVRESEHQIVYEEYALWAEKPVEAFVKNFAERLMGHPAVGQVSAPPWRQDLEPDLYAQLAVTRFEGTGEGRVILRARWQLRDARDESVISRGRVTLTRDGWARDDYADLAAKLSELLAALADRVGDDIGAHTGTGG